MATGSSHKQNKRGNKNQMKNNLKCVVLGDKENAIGRNSALPHSEKKLRDRVISSAGRNKRAR